VITVELEVRSVPEILDLLILIAPIMGREGNVVIRLEDVQDTLSRDDRSVLIEIDAPTHLLVLRIEVMEIVPAGLNLVFFRPDVILMVLDEVVGITVLIEFVEAIL
jgi:hypothetical protein